MFHWERKQTNFFDDVNFLGEHIFNQDHILVKMEKLIQWDELEKALMRFYSPGRGCPTNPLRAQAATLMLKHLYNHSDRDAVNLVKENIYAQRFCGLTFKEAQDYMCPANGLTNFRNNIGKEGQALIAEVLDSCLRRKNLIKNRKMITDTTAVPADIRYPTDIHLLEQCRKQILRFLSKAKGWGVTRFFRTYSRTAKKVYAIYQKIRRLSNKKKRNIHKKMIQFVRRNLEQLKEVKKLLEREVIKAGEKQRKHLLKLLKQMKEAEKDIEIILAQQKTLYNNKKAKITDRIVSIFKPHVRPIQRGKFPIRTEFGKKIVVHLINGFLFLREAFDHNINDAQTLVKSLRFHKEFTGKLPKEVNGDRGIYSKFNVDLLKKLPGVKNIGLQKRGIDTEKSFAKKRMARERCGIEAGISLFKRKFGGSRCRYRKIENEIPWTQMGLAMMNLKLALCRAP